MKSIKKSFILLLIFSIVFLVGCTFSYSNVEEKDDETVAPVDPVEPDDENQGETTDSSEEEESIRMEDEVLEETEDTREGRVLSSEQVKPSNLRDTSVMWKVKRSRMTETGKNVAMNADCYQLVFTQSLGVYHPVIKVNGETVFQINNPVKLYIKKTGQLEYSYDSVEINEYGVLATCNIITTKGSNITVEDQYYYPRDNSIGNAINVQRLIHVNEASKDEQGFQSIFSVNSLNSDTKSLEWFMPNIVFGDYEVSGTMNYRIFRETLMGIPMIMMRDKSCGAYVSIARYQPVIDNESNSLACLELHKGSNSIGDKTSSLEICYPTRDSSRKYFASSENSQIVYDITIQVGVTSDFDEAMIESYDTQYTLEDPRIVDTDIDEVYKVIGEDFKSFMQSNTANGVTSYGLPWTVTIENGHFGGMSYQSGFVGQQVPCAYNMMVFGIKYSDSESLQNGLNIINFWVNGCKLLTDAGVPRVWYFGWDNTWAGYPTFLRMAVDTMEGLLDAYRLAEAYDIETSNWYETLVKTANWLVKAQNSDGSFYRCYNYQGTYYKGTESDISWNPGDICQSKSKNNTPIAIRFLGKMYELTGDVRYYQACIKAGNFTYNNLYGNHCYYGGTCDNPDQMDKEAGVYAMYAYDTLYNLTGDSKWLKCLEQATVFTMSTVLTVGFKIDSDASDLKAALYAIYGYTDGLSFIGCGGSGGVDNYAAYMYYELFRVYILTGKEVYYHMAEFIQQNTKSSMDWDGVFGYAYKSLTPEASTVYNFGFNSAKDDEGLEGCCLPWQEAANAEPIAKMYEVFGSADVKTYKDTDIKELRKILTNFGIGGKSHKKY